MVTLYCPINSTQFQNSIRPFELTNVQYCYSQFAIFNLQSYNLHFKVIIIIMILSWSFLTFGWFFYPDFLLLLNTQKLFSFLQIYSYIISNSIPCFWVFFLVNWLNGNEMIKWARVNWPGWIAGELRSPTQRNCQLWLVKKFCLIIQLHIDMQYWN